MAATEPTHEVTETAAAWLLALEAGTADAEAFAAWRDADPRHALAFAECVSLWNALDGVKAAPAAPTAGSGSAEDVAAYPQPVAAMPRRRFLAAAGIAGLLTLGGAGWLLRSTPASARTAIGERRLIALGDGSKIELNTNSEVAWRVDGADRTVWLREGEIAIDVASGVRPLQLEVLDRVMALAPGRYNARLVADQLELLVLQGHARATGRTIASGSMLTQRGDRVTAAPAAPLRLARAAAWRRGELVFDGDTLGFAVAEYNRHLTTPIRIADPAVVGLRLGGRFDVTQSEAFLAAVAASLDLQIARDPEGRPLIRRRDDVAAN